MRSRREPWTEDKLRWQCWQLARDRSFPPVRLSVRTTRPSGDAEDLLIALPEGGERGWLGLIVDLDAGDLEPLIARLMAGTQNDRVSRPVSA